MFISYIYRKSYAGKMQRERYALNLGLQYFVAVGVELPLRDDML